MREHVEKVDVLGWNKSLGYCMAGAFFEYSEVVATAKKSEKKKGKKKKRKGEKGNV